VASGAYDICLALGVEKLKDTGYGGLPEGGSNLGTLYWLWYPKMSAPGAFAQLATAYAAKYGIPDADLKRAMAQVSVKSHDNGILNSKAHLRRSVTIEQVMNAPIVAYPLGLFDCCGVSDGAACAVVTTVEKARDLGIKNPVTVKALQLALSSGEEMGYNEWDGTYFMTTNKCSTQAYKEAGITSPRKEISMMEVHDCFSITELVTCEDLHISDRGNAWHDFLDGFYNRDGKIPCQLDGGLKCFGHPIGASGLRMLYEMYLQLLGRAGERQIENPRYGLTHNLGGRPFQNVCSIAIIGPYKQ
jgi:acetyl-CoA C-acetyltransferase